MRIHWCCASALPCGLTAADVRVMVDATAAQEVAAQHPRWLSRGEHVVSANKLALGGALADWDALQAAAEAAGHPLR